MTCLPETHPWLDPPDLPRTHHPQNMLHSISAVMELNFIYSIIYNMHQEDWSSPFVLYQPTLWGQFTHHKRSIDWSVCPSPEQMWAAHVSAKLTKLQMPSVTTEHAAHSHLLRFNVQLRSGNIMAWLKVLFWKRQMETSAGDLRNTDPSLRDVNTTCSVHVITLDDNIRSCRLGSNSVILSSHLNMNVRLSWLILVSAGGGTSLRLSSFIRPPVVLQLPWQPRPHQTQLHRLLSPVCATERNILKIR